MRRGCSGDSLAGADKVLKLSCLMATGRFDFNRYFNLTLSTSLPLSQHTLTHVPGFIQR